MDQFYIIKFSMTSDETNPTELYLQIWNLIETNIRKICTSAADEMVTEEYLEEAMDDGYADKVRMELYYLFRHVAGCCYGSAAACCHWFELSYTQLFPQIRALAADLGFDIQEPGHSLTELLSKSETPFITISGALYYIQKSEGELQLITDSDDKHLGDFTAKTQTKIKDIADIGACQCSMCVKLRRKMIK
jgi:hypothetical protein